MHPRSLKFSSPPGSGEGTLTVEDSQLTFYESNSERENDLMVSGIINPFSAQVEVVVPHLGVKGVVKALIDSGCTRCLVSLQMVWKLGLRVKKLRQP